MSVDDLELFLEYTRRRHREAGGAGAGLPHGAGTGGGTPRAGAGTGGGTPRAGAGAGVGVELVGGRKGGTPSAGCAAGTPSAGAPPGGAGAGTTGGAWCSDSCSDVSEVDAWELAIGDKHGVAVVDG